MHFSIYVRLLDLLWEHLDDEDRFRQLAHEAVVGQHLLDLGIRAPRGRGAVYLSHAGEDG